MRGRYRDADCDYRLVNATVKGQQMKLVEVRPLQQGVNGNSLLSKTTEKLGDPIYLADEDGSGVFLVTTGDGHVSHRHMVIPNHEVEEIHGERAATL